MRGSSARKWIGLIAATLGSFFLNACGRGNSPTVGPTPTPTPTPSAVTVTFTDGVPRAAAVKMGSGAFTAASIQNGQISFTLPTGVSSYELAYVCPPQGPTGLVTTNEFVIEATLADGTSYSTSCLGQPAMGSATGTVDATAIPGAAKVFIAGKGGNGNSLNATSGSFNASMPVGTNDVAVVAQDTSGKVLALKILRSQSVPGAINGGSPIVLSASDEVTLQSATVNNTPAGFIPPELFVLYRTGNGTVVELQLSAASTYPAVPAAAAQAGDSYFIDCSTDDTATGGSVVGVNEIINSATPLTINLPAVWSYSGPVAAAFPSFTFNYPGFPSGSNLVFEASIGWFTTSTTTNLVQVDATSSFQNGSTTLSIPDLTSLPGFLAPASSGTTVGWTATILNEQQSLSFLPSAGANGIGPLVINRATYVEP